MIRRAILLLTATIAAVAMTGGLALAAPADLDPTFDVDGKVVTDFGHDEGARDVAVQDDGKIVVLSDSLQGETEQDDPRDSATSPWCATTPTAARMPHSTATGK